MRIAHLLFARLVSLTATAALGCSSLTSPGDPEPITADTGQPSGAAPTNAGNKGPAPTTLQIKDEVVGSGPAAKNGDHLSVLYKGTLFSDGSEFDGSEKHGNKPIEVTLGQKQVIDGWERGLVGMQVGGRRTLTIPAAMAYGAQARPGIPANSTLVFDTQLVGLKPGDGTPAALPTAPAAPPPVVGATLAGKRGPKR